MNSSVLALLCLLFVSASGFLPISSRLSQVNPQSKNVLCMAEIKITNPSQDEAADMGIRDWPGQLKKGTWEENSGNGQTLVRYVLDGTGSLEIESIGDSSKSSKKLSPGTLVEVTGESVLSWQADEEMLLLTPGFEEGGKFLAVLAGLVALLLSIVTLS